MREVATISNNNIRLSDRVKYNMKSAVSAIIFASIISITTGETTVPTPSLTSAPFPLTPTATCTGSTPGWVDAVGDGCAWYEMNDEPGCPKYGDFGGYDWKTGEPIIGEPGSVPKDNCCYCFGICTGSTPGWADVDGAGCGWYEENDLPGCPWYGNYGGTDANTGVANDNCCYCFGDAPADAYLIMCFVEVIASGISAISVLALLIAILRNPKVRSNTFNLYLVFCLAPDAVYSPLMTFKTVRYLVYEIKFRAIGEWPVPLMQENSIGKFTMWCHDFWFCGSLWMSFSVFVQIYKLLMANKRAKRYQPPTRKRVIRDSTIILIISGIVAASITLWYVYYQKETWGYRAYLILIWTSRIPILYIPTLLITGMCFRVWWNKLIPRKNARYRSLTMFFARLLASAYLMVIGAVSKQLITWYWPEEDVEKFQTYSFFMFYLFGFLQVCLTLTKKDIRDAFVQMWCCRGIGVRFIAATGRTARPTAEESYEPDGYDGEPAIVDNATSSAVNSSGQNQDVYENDGNETNTAFVDTTEQNEGTIVKDTDEEEIGENCSGIDEKDDVPNENDGNEGSTSFVESTKQNDRSIIENEGSVIDDIDGEERIGAEDCSDIDETNNEIAMSKEDKNSVQV